MSCWHKESIRRSGNATALGKAIATWTGRKPLQSCGLRKARPSTHAVAKDNIIVKPPASINCHESRRVEGVRVDPVLDTTSAGRKRRAHTRLSVRQLFLVSKANRRK